MISVAGASGNVGRLVVKELVRMGLAHIRLGGRNQHALFEIAEEVPYADIFPFDLTCERDSVRFCEGSSVVVNCAGPSYIILDRLAHAASVASAPYVDASGDYPVYKLLLARQTSCSALLSAGALPGLSGLVPRWMAKGFDHPNNLSTYVGGLERCSTASTIDMLLSMDGKREPHGEPLAGWRSGRKASKALRPAKNLEVPFVPDRVNAYPFFSIESERLACDLRLNNCDFWNIFAGEKLIDTFIQQMGGDFSEDHLGQALEDLNQAATLDLLGRKPYYMLVFQMDGVANGEAVSRTVALRTHDAYRLIATMTALTALALVEGKATEGIGFAAEMVDPDWAVSVLRQSPSLDAFEIADRRYGENAIEEGVI